MTNLPDTNEDFENYVSEILFDMRRLKPQTSEAFRSICHEDLNAGYSAEVDEAERRYFAQVRNV